MQTTTDEIAPDVFRISTFVPEVGPAKEAEAVFKATCLTPTTGATIRSLADLQPTGAFGRRVGIRVDEAVRTVVFAVFCYYRRHAHLLLGPAGVTACGGAVRACR